MSPDPLELDQTVYAALVRQLDEDLQRGEDAVPEEPPHPFLDDPAVAALVRRIEAFDQELREGRQVAPLSRNDAYFIFREDMVLRLPVVVKVVLDFLRKHPQMMTR